MLVFSSKLKELREEKKLSKRAMARSLGVAEATYRRYEKGECEPSNTLLLKIADFFGVSLDYLFGRVDI